MINTLKLKESLEANGFNSTQASALSHAINETSVKQSNLATKQELYEVRREFKEEMKALRDELRDFKKFMEAKLDQIQESILDKVTNRTLICQITIAAILVSIMIFFHQNP